MDGVQYLPQVNDKRNIYKPKYTHIYMEKQWYTEPNYTDCCNTWFIEESDICSKCKEHTGGHYGTDND